MTAPVYTARRSILAKQIGLGRKRADTRAACRAAAKTGGGLSTVILIEGSTTLSSVHRNRVG